ncbi:MAG: NAD(+)/NADH kinase [Acidobacteriota bacterium]|nr:NAD(+)/NADH kinase [Acidobacteriota bacterium]
MRIGIAVKPGLAEARETLIGVEQWLQTHAVDAVWTEEAAELLPPATRTVVTRAALPADLTLLLVLGGDGTLLALAKAIAEAGLDIPLLAVNFGSLGFLTEITRPEIYASLDAVLNGRATHDERMMLKAVATRSGSITTHLALNDVVFTRTALSRMIELDVSVGDQFVTSVKADGLIVASPTGSTAYNLAAGGPIVHPAMDALVLTPIAPHSLTNRPIVIPSEREVRVKSTGTNAGNVYVTIDGQTGFEMGQGDEVAIARAARPLRLVRASARSYFEVLRQKLKWNER